MLYRILFFPARIAIHFYCRKIIVNNKEILAEAGPLLIASNHPNSFMDAVIVSTLFKSPVYSLARGDAFNRKIAAKLLKSCNMLPVYRKSEGAGNLRINYDTFNECEKLFKQNKIVLIFSEGGCINEWKLRPIRKGTARLALNAWQNNIPLKVLPLGINYSSFKFFGKNVTLNFGKVISKNNLPASAIDGKRINEFNEKLNEQLKELVFEIQQDDYETVASLFYSKQPVLKKILLFLPAIIGFIINAPLYFVLHLIIKDRATDHYDSIMMGLLFFLFPIYVFVITLIVFAFTKSLYSLLLLAFLPFAVWSYLQLKRQIKK